MKYTEEFEAFWNLYPKRWNKNLGIYVKRKKVPAFQKWQKLDEEIRARCIRVVKKIKYHDDAIRDAVTWLNQEGWEDIEEPEEGVKHLPEEFTNTIKIVPQHKVNVNNRRNEEIKKLEG